MQHPRVRAAAHSQSSVASRTRSADATARRPPAIGCAVVAATVCVAMRGGSASHEAAAAGVCRAPREGAEEGQPGWRPPRPSFALPCRCAASAAICPSMTRFGELVAVSDAVAATRSRTQKVRRLADFLRAVPLVTRQSRIGVTLPGISDRRSRWSGVRFGTCHISCSLAVSGLASARGLQGVGAPVPLTKFAKGR